MWPAEIRFLALFKACSRHLPSVMISRRCCTPATAVVSHTSVLSSGGQVCVVSTQPFLPKHRHVVQRHTWPLTGVLSSYFWHNNLTPGWRAKQLFLHNNLIPDWRAKQVLLAHQVPTYRLQAERNAWWSKPLSMQAHVYPQTAHS